MRVSVGVFQGDFDIKMQMVFYGYKNGFKKLHHTMQDKNFDFDFRKQVYLLECYFFCEISCLYPACFCPPFLVWNVVSCPSACLCPSPSSRALFHSFRQPLQCIPIPARSDRSLLQPVLLLPLLPEATLRCSLFLREPDSSHLSAKLIIGLLSRMIVEKSVRPAKIRHDEKV